MNTLSLKCSIVLLICTMFSVWLLRPAPKRFLLGCPFPPPNHTQIDAHIHTMFRPCTLMSYLHLTRQVLLYFRYQSYPRFHGIETPNQANGKIWLTPFFASYYCTRYCVPLCVQWWHAGHACGRYQRERSMCPLAYVLAARWSLLLFPR
jgi:hypothetical protein